MISRRKFLGTSLGAGAALALTPELLRAFEQSGARVNQRQRGGTPPPPPGPAVKVPAAILDRYVGEYKTGFRSMLIVRRKGAVLFAKPGANPEAALSALSETRFSDPRGAILVFQLDAGGKVTGLVIEQGTQKIPATRVR